MLHHVAAEHFDDWRSTARHLVQSDVPPDRIRWVDQRAEHSSGQGDLFQADLSAALPPPTNAGEFRVSAKFLSAAETVSHHRDPQRWELLYQTLWRIVHGQRHLMEVASDKDVFRIVQMEKAVRRDAHKMKAFVRFRRMEDESGEHYIAWHRPDHYPLRIVGDFFARRFNVMRWTIMTPDESASWDGDCLTYAAGMPREAAPSFDELESLWKTYYANIFNPARIKLNAMRAEMPKKHWPTLPETEMITEMLQQAPERTRQMIQTTAAVSTAQPFVPNTDDLRELAAASRQCRGCDLCQQATQTVFGAGPTDAQTVFVGEQPGDQEDLRGTPFVGPAGQVLDQVLQELGIRRDTIYLTNAVKHFKFTRSAKRRLHQKPSARQVAACRPWLEAELSAIGPQHLICLGATAARVVLGPNFRLTEQRGVAVATEYAPWTLATLHPSAILRAPAKQSQVLMEQFRSDLALWASQIEPSS
ncbi:UdgX family uracil-DNA binding protein [Roseiconus nitratireducens]|uniref:Type-4 uracil-DNA glycosylase n=1 Tax=Roseiconus nitratireducens TaxID=2605748 RepID=A0A5M6DEF7_9BACT|nr:UdgX family uracil-DNA binding protein [Roseiconus nitratireducens]KAA5544559.1 UdgX family uracil-DNA binding protein [Roseiconus nitratireducens]